MKPRSILIAVYILIILLNGSYSTAQNINGGLTAGASVNTINLESAFSSASNPDNLKGFEAGLYMRFSFGGFYLSPSAIAGYQKGTVTFYENESAPVSSGFSLTTFETPLMAGFQFLPFISLEAGPSWNYLLGYSGGSNAPGLSFSRSALGYRAGVRAQVSRLGFFAHYGGILTKQPGNKFDLERPSRILFGVCFDFGNHE